MDEERFQRLETIFHRALEQPAGPLRDEYLSRECTNEPELLLRILSLIEADQENTSSPAPVAPEEPPAALPLFGVFQAEKILGRGGAGVVYLARRIDGEFDQVVAVKALLPEAASGVLREGFLRERRILAALHHPGIAQVLDGGIRPDGTPYLVMEYVEGRRVDVYCAEQRFGLRQRIVLFLAVCDAVAFAHRHLVVHLDLKPSNILVTADGHVKLLDFGTAKILDAVDSSVTQALATPRYASPEQLRGERAGIASDTYSLGIVLTELATGHWPFGDPDSQIQTLRRAVEDVEPRPLPSLAQESHAESCGMPLDQLRRELGGDLGAIVSKALNADPERRYQTVDELAQDLRNFGQARPVLARPQTRAYRAARFVRRNRWVVAFAAIFVSGMLAMTGYSVAQARIAEREAARALAANQFLTTIFQLPFWDADSHRDMTVRELLDLAEKRVIPSLGAMPDIAADVEFVLGGGFESQQVPDRARELYARMLERARQSGDVPRQAIATGALAGVAYNAGHLEQAWSQAVESAELWKRSPGRFTPEQAVSVLTNAGRLMEYMRQADPASRGYLEEAVRIARQHSRQVASGRRASAFQALAESYLASSTNAQENYSRAYPLIEQAVAIARADPALTETLFVSLQSWGRVNRFLGRYDQDEAAQREAYQLLVKHIGDDHPRAANQRGVWAVSLAGAGKIEEAYRQSQAALVTMRRFYPEQGSFQLWTNTAAAAYAACLTSRFGECEILAREALRTLGENPPVDDLRVYEAKSYLGIALAGEGRDAEAMAMLTGPVQFYRARGRTGPFRDVLEQAYARARAR